MSPNTLVLQEAAARGGTFSGAFCFQWYLKYCKTNCFFVLYQCLWFLPKVLIIPGHCTWQNSHIKWEKTEDVWLNYSQLHSCFHIVMIIDSIQNLTQVHRTASCKSGPKSVLIKSVLRNLSRTENGHNLFMLLHLWPFLLIQWKGVFADMVHISVNSTLRHWRGTDR